MDWKTSFCKKFIKQAEIRGVPTPYFHVVKEWPHKYATGYYYVTVYFDFSRGNRGHTTWCLSDADLKNLKLQGGGPDVSIVVNQSVYDEGIGGGRRRTPREVMGLFALYRDTSRKNKAGINEEQKEREYEQEILSEIDELDEIHEPAKEHEQETFDF